MKLDPPSDLQSNVSSDSCVLTWGISPALEPLASLLSYELAFKRQEEAWEVMLGLASWGPGSLLIPHRERLMRREVTRAKRMCVQACTYLYVCVRGCLNKIYVSAHRHAYVYACSEGGERVGVCACASQHTGRGV